MGSDRQSILLHESGRKHKEALEQQLLDKRQSKASQASSALALEASLQQMEAAARSSLTSDLRYFAQPWCQQQQQQIAAFVPTSQVPSYQAAGPVVEAVLSQHSATTDVSQSHHPPSNGNSKLEKKEWEKRKQHRIDEKAKTFDPAVGEHNDNIDDEAAAFTRGNNNKKRKIIPLDEGHYTINETTYLEGPVFGDLIEEEMPVELWRGAEAATAAEQRLPYSAAHWTAALVVVVRKKSSEDADYNSDKNRQQQLLLDVAYLKSAEAVDETVEQNVPLNRIRIVLGSDEKVPESLEEALIMAMGGEEEQVKPTDLQQVDDITGLGGWSTVSVKRTTVRQELKEERVRLREARRAAALETERQKKEAEVRRMEESVVANAEDSALGAYDVWNRSGEGYKGVDIHGEGLVEVHELGKKLVRGASTTVGFKRKHVVGKKSSRNRRTTSADDD
jgi:hypothetical protein